MKQILSSLKQITLLNRKPLTAHIIKRYLHLSPVNSTMAFKYPIARRDAEFSEDYHGTKVITIYSGTVLLSGDSERSLNWRNSEKRLIL